MENEEKENVEGDAPSHAEKRDGQQYNPAIEHADIVVVGEHNTVGLNYRDTSDIVEDRINARFTDIHDLVKHEVAEVLKDLRQNDDYVGISPPSISLEEEEFPTDLEQWFYKLPLEKQYTIQALAILHGGKAYEISQARELLVLTPHTTTVQTDTTSTTGLSTASSLSTSSFQSSSELYRGTYTEFRSIYGTERIFLRDTDTQGNSSLRINLLRFLSREALRGSWGPRGQHFLTIAEECAESSKGDSYWRAAQALGVIWSQDPERLQRIANDWANGTAQRDWRRAASLLYGAYEFEQVLGNEVGLQRSRVLSILKQWIERTHTSGNSRVGSAAAYTYGQLARRSPEVALQGLDDLLNLPLRPELPPDKQGIVLPVFASLVSNYVNLVWQGHLRLLLQHIATQVEEFVQKRTQAARPIEKAKRNFRRTIALETLFTVFFLVASESQPDVSEPRSVLNLSNPLQDPSQLPAIDGRDTLLVGLLTQGPNGWRREITTILCGAIIEQKSLLAFDFLKDWTQLVLQEQEKEGATKSYHSLVCFFAEIDELLFEWTQGLTRAGFTKQQARVTFWRRLHSWRRKSLAFQKFVDDVRTQREKQINLGR